MRVKAAPVWSLRGGAPENAGQAEGQRDDHGGSGPAEARETCEPPPPVRAALAGDRGQRRPPGHGQFRQRIAQLPGQGAVVRVLVVVHRPVSVKAGASSPRKADMARDR